MTKAVDKPFVPAFHMPVIAPPPEDYGGTPDDYYKAIDPDLTVTELAVAAEVLHPAQFPSPEPKALQITIGSPDGVFTGTADAFPWSTIFAVLGGELSYVPATDPLPLDKNLFPNDVKLSDVLNPKPSAAAGTLVLRVWPLDLKKLKDALGGIDPPSTIYLIGVDEDSLGAHIPQSIAAVYPDKAKRALKKQLESAGVSVGSTAKADDLRMEFLQQFKKGSLSFTVRGEVPIARAANLASTPLITIWHQNALGKFEHAFELYKEAVTYAF